MALYIVSLYRMIDLFHTQTLTFVLVLIPSNPYVSFNVEHVNELNSVHELYPQITMVVYKINLSRYRIKIHNKKFRYNPQKGSNGI